MSEKFNGMALRRLIEVSGYSLTDITESTGVPEEALDNHISYTEALSLTDAIKVADFFTVPLDAIVGRDYRQSFDLPHDPAGRDLSWPYNLLAQVNGYYTKIVDPVDYQISPEHEADIVNTINAMLSENKARVILGHLRDHCTLAALAKEIGMSSSRAGQLLRIGLTDLRRGAIRDRILFGPEVIMRRNMLQEEELELDKQRMAIEKQRNELLAAERELWQHAERLGQLKNSLASGQSSASDLAGSSSRPESSCTAVIKDLAAANIQTPLSEKVTASVYSTKLADIDFSVRAFNCLARAGCNTLGDVVKCIEEGRLLKVRNLGRHTAEEVLAKVQELTGQDFFEAYQKYL